MASVFRAAICACGCVVELSRRQGDRFLRQCQGSVDMPECPSEIGAIQQTTEQTILFPGYCAELGDRLIEQVGSFFQVAREVELLAGAASRQSGEFGMASLHGHAVSGLCERERLFLPPNVRIQLTDLEQLLDRVRVFERTV